MFARDLANIQMVTYYKYLRVHLNNKLDWTDHTATTYDGISHGVVCQSSSLSTAGSKTG